MTPVMTDINLYYIKFMLLISDIFLSHRGPLVKSGKYEEDYAAK